MVRRFLFNGLSAGIKKTGEKDLGLIFSEIPAVAAGVFTRNWIKAAPVLLTQNKLQKRSCQAVLVNSGNANACTGKQGMLDAQRLVKETAHHLGLPLDKVAICSTGVIGEPLAVPKMANTLPELCRGLQADKIEDFAQAIMTTDTVHKVVTDQATIGGKRVRMAGIVKGAGMINPSMATMLGFIVTDAAVQPQSIQALLAEGADRSFNRITVDSDTSTNDTVLLLANGAAENKALSKAAAEKTGFTTMLHSVMEGLAQKILEDAEGVTKIIELTVSKAKSNAEAETIARSIADSPLVKTAFYGEEVNWGRIVAAAGKTPYPIVFERLELSINGIPLIAKGGAILPENEAKAKREIRNQRLSVSLVLNQGRQEARVFTTDLSTAYVDINAGYKS
jgi:glutamate N-acetyltransferase/amino-acid N-acetyltransferase